MADVGIVVFPGSNCDRDAYHAVSGLLKRTAEYHWHAEPVGNKYKAVILPGGFSYGDYLRAGALAKISPAVESLREFVDRGGLVLGICNGFQILVEAGFLPGALTKNRSLRFQCEDVYMRVESNDSPFLCKAKPGQVLRMPIAHSEGRYLLNDQELSQLERQQRIALRYCDPNGELVDTYNANGSISAIAGVTNEKKNVMGLMPHPERCSEELLGNRDGIILFESLLASL